MPELTDHQRWSYRVFASTMPVLRLLNDLARPASCAEIATVLAITPKTAKRYLVDLEHLRCVAHLPDSGEYTALAELDELLAAESPGPPPPGDFPMSISTPASGPARMTGSFPTGPNPDIPLSTPQEPPPTVEEKIFPSQDAVVVVNDLNINKLMGLTATTAPQRGKFFTHPGQLAAFPWLAGRLPGELPPPDPQPPDPPPIPDEVRHALAAAGIGEPKRSQIGRLAHITPAYVRGWHAHLQANGAARTTGLLVHVLEQGDPLPESAGKYGADGEFHLKSCKCKACVWGDLLCQDCGEYPCECPVTCPDCGEEECLCDFEAAEGIPLACECPVTCPDCGEEECLCDFEAAEGDSLACECPDTCPDCGEEECLCDFEAAEGDPLTCECLESPQAVRRCAIEAVPMEASSPEPANEHPPGLHDPGGRNHPGGMTNPRTATHPANPDQPPGSGPPRARSPDGSASHARSPVIPPCSPSTGAPFRYQNARVLPIALTTAGGGP